MRTWLAALALALAVAGPASAQAHVLIISGLGGEQRYIDDFHTWGTTMVDAARERMGLPRENVVYLAENPARDPSRIDGASRREEIERALRSLAQRAGPDDRILLLLIGHGGSDSRGVRLNVPGPNLTADDLAAFLQPFRTQPLVIVNTASASGGFQAPLAGPNRVIVTATRSEMERNETLFGGFFVAAFAGEGADADQDGRISIQEAFDYARQEVERAYRSSNRLQMENARMEGDEQLARSFTLGGGLARAPADASPELRALYAERQRLEDAVAGLRTRSGQMPAEAYQRELEGLLIELARTTQRIRALEGSDR
jgi:hypothetical protein